MPRSKRITDENAMGMRGRIVVDLYPLADCKLYSIVLCTSTQVHNKINGQ